jgi:hypothetical protein
MNKMEARYATVSYTTMTGEPWYKIPGCLVLDYNPHAKTYKLVDPIAKAVDGRQSHAGRVIFWADENEVTFENEGA